MKSGLNIWLDFSSKEFGREAAREDEDDLFLALKQHFGADRIQHEDWGIAFDDCQPAEVSEVKERARRLRIPITCKMEERFKRSELRQLRFVELLVDGDNVDDNRDGTPLNRFPFVLCDVCNMPDESRLPEPFQVSARQILRRGQDGVPNLRLPSKREIFGAGCGVLVVNDRVKQILEALNQPFTCSAVLPGSSEELPYKYWAVRPTVTWGRRVHIWTAHPCLACARPARRHVDRDASENIWSNRIIVEKEPAPETDLVCEETWFGDREEHPIDFLRPIYISGQLCEVLLQLGVRGLVMPEDFIAFEDGIVTVDDANARAWVAAKVQLLKAKGLQRAGQI